MTSALQIPPVADLRASNSHDIRRDARITSSAVADTAYNGIKGKPAPVQIDHLERLMYCLPISESKSLPETTIKGTTRTASPDDSSQNVNDSHGSSSDSPPLEVRDHTGPNLPIRDADVSKETKEASEPHHPRCECGCVPPIPTLFEMAELRRQHRLRLQNGDKSESKT